MPRSRTIDAEKYDSNGRFVSKMEISLVPLRDSIYITIEKGNGSGYATRLAVYKKDILNAIKDVCRE